MFVVVVTPAGNMGAGGGANEVGVASDFAFSCPEPMLFSSKYKASVIV